jgi:membrane-bound lytic murein transglycosylase D
MRKKIIQLICLGIAFLFARPAVFGTSEILPKPDPFPVYPCLQTNVDFWKKVYTEYTLEQAIIHDSGNVSIIYEVIDLEDADRPGVLMINKKRIKRAQGKYKDILTKLARGNPPSSPEEQRVVDLFGPTATRKDFEQARRQIRCQLGQMDRFQEGIIRSGAMLGQIKEVFQSYGLPADLAYLPHVESSFNHKARSKSRAAGIWQFTPPTAKRFLKIGHELDERRDPIFSSHAAARLLRENYEVLGDWPMAITAYNHGLGGMLKARRAKKSYEAIFSEYKSRSFRFASRNFYSEFLAAREVAKNYRQYFGDLELDQPPSTHEVVVGNRVPVKDLARYFNVNVADIKDLNPSLKESVYRGKKSLPRGYPLRLPLTAAAPVQAQETLATEPATDLQGTPRGGTLFPSPQ